MLGLRLYLPKKPTLTETSLSDKDYCELSTRFKAAHVKVMVYWIAMKCQEAAHAAPQVSRKIFTNNIFGGLIMQSRN